MANRCGKSRNSDRFCFLGFQNHCREWLQTQNKKNLLLGRKAVTNIDSILKSRQTPLLTNVCISSVSQLCLRGHPGASSEDLWNMQCLGNPARCCSAAKLYLTLCHPMNCSTPGLPAHHQLPEFTQTHVHWVGDAIQPSHPLSSPSPPAPNPSQHQGLFQWVNSSHEVAKVLEFQLQHHSFQWTPRTDLL